MNMRRRLLAAGALAWLALGQAAAGTPMSADEELKAREYFTDLVLFNQDGQEVRFFSDVLKDQVVVINFIFTNCGGACPMMTEKLRMARDLMEEDLAARIRYVSISIDPLRDTPAALKEFARTHRADGNWVFLTGKQEHIDQIVQRLGQYSEEVEAHSTMMLAGNVNKRHWSKIEPMVPPAGIAERLRSLAATE